MSTQTDPLNCSHSVHIANESLTFPLSDNSDVNYMDLSVLFETEENVGKNCFSNNILISAWHVFYEIPNGA